MNDELTTLWKIRKQNKNEFLKCKSSKEIKRNKKNNLQKFWQSIKTKKRKSNLPTVIKDYDGSVITDHTEIMNRWRSDFSLLYNVDIDRYENDPEYIPLLNLKNDLEAQQNLPGYKYNSFLNGELSFGEIEKAVKQLKKNKATDCDNIPN